jgi:hypothetical protein
MIILHQITKYLINKKRQNYTHGLIRKNEQNDFLRFPHYYKNLVLAVPIDTSGETSSKQEGDDESTDVWWVFLVTYKLNLRSYKLCVGPTPSSKYP